MDFTRQIFNNCIFCGNELPAEYDGEGEHVIPKNLGSSWHIDVVCTDCRKYFGDHIDQLGISNPYIIEAMATLGIDGADSHRRNIPHIARDVLTGNPTEMAYHQGDFRSRMIVNETDPLDGSSTPEKHFETHIRHIARGLQSQGLTPEDLDPEINEVLNWMQSASAGDIYHSELFGTHFRKMTAKGIYIDSDRLKSLSPLIAKIIVCTLHMLLSDDQLKQVLDLQDFKKHARFGGKLEPHQCGPIHPRGDDRPQPSQYHSIYIEFFEKALLCDIRLFRTVLWRSILKTTDAISLEKSDGIVSKLNFIIDIAEEGNTRKFLRVMHKDSTDWVGGELEGL